MKKFVNCLTLSRIVATFLLPIVWKYLNPIAIIIFVACILLTDFFDGFLARKFRVQSLFGSTMDTVADKTFGLVMILILAKYIKMFYLLFALELCIAIINLTAALFGATTKSSFLGKTKMWLLGVSILIGIICINEKELLDIVNVNIIHKIILFIVDNANDILLITISIASGATAMVATDYLRHILKEMKNKKKKINLNLKSKEELFKVLFDTEHYLKHKNEPLSKSLIK